MSNVWENNIILLMADELAHLIYRLTRSFPRDEIYGITSQIRRASLSVVLNMVEGYARFKVKSHINFLEMAFGSLKETQYLLDFSFKEKYLSQLDHDKAAMLSQEVGKMLYSKIKH